jgi:amidase
MKRIRRSQTTCLFGPDQAPVVEIEPGEAVLLETEDAQAGRVKTHADALGVILPESEANPVTGPVWVRDSRPGDTLAVRVVEIFLAPRGLGRVRPGRGVLGDEVTAPTAKLIPVQEGLVHFDEHIRFPVRPMVGTIGTAPASESIPSFCPGPHGGNLDINAATAGATVYLPVAVPGALLALGDVHACMGDGELTGGGIDIRAEVVVQVDLHRALAWQRPVIETPDTWCTCASAPELSEAIRLATGDMARLLAGQLGLSFEESYILIGAAGDVRIGQAAEVGVDMTACLCISKRIMPAAF